MDSTAAAANSRYNRLTKALEWPMALLALAVIPALLLDNGSATPMTHAVATAVNWFVWLAFCTEFALRLSAAPERGTFLKKSWFDIFIIVVSPPFGVPQTLQGLRALRAVRLLRLLRLMRAIALRIDEALGLERERVDLDALTLTARGKGDRHRVVPISIQGRKALFRLFARDGSRFVFTTDTGQRMSYRNAYRDLKKLCRRAGVQGSHVRPHCIRHYFAVSFIRAGGDLYRLSRILGHSSIATTQLYLRSMGLEHLQEGHAKYSPLGRLA
jgi:integrase